MAHTFSFMQPGGAHAAFLLRWAPVMAGLLALYVPTYVSLAHGAWNDEQNAHGPLILLVVMWLLWQMRDRLLALPENGAWLSGAVVMVAGLLLYILGRTVEIIYFDAFSQLLVVAGVLLAVFGWSAIRVLWFPLVFMLFLVPLPGVLVDAMTGPLKQMVSYLAENILYDLGYPISRSGVVLTIGQYQLLVADACSGLNSLYSLTALGMLFLHITYDGNPVRTAIVLASIWPIAFAANIVRVLSLVLITYYFGDESGQGFMHNFSGMLLFVIALGLLYFVHALTGQAWKWAKAIR